MRVQTPNKFKCSEVREVERADVPLPEPFSAHGQLCELWAGNVERGLCAVMPKTHK